MMRDFQHIFTLGMTQIPTDAQQNSPPILTPASFCFYEESVSFHKKWDWSSTGGSTEYRDANSKVSNLLHCFKDGSMASFKDNNFPQQSMKSEMQNFLWWGNQCEWVWNKMARVTSESVWELKHCETIVFLENSSSERIKTIFSIWKNWLKLKFRIK